MKVLVLSILPPLPLDSGGQVRIYNLLKLYPDDYELHLLTFATEKEKERLYSFGQCNFKELQNMFTSINIIDRQANDHSGIKKYYLYFKTLMNDIPLNFLYFYSDEFIVSLKKIIDENKIDIVHFESMYLSPYKKYLPGNVKTILNHHNIEHQLIKYNYCNFNKRLFKKLFAKGLSLWNYYVTKKYELKKLADFNCIITISIHDLKYMQMSSQYKNVEYVPVTFDKLYKYNYELNQSKDTFNITFVGGFDWYPNLSGVLWFLEHVFKKINNRNNIQFHVVGKNARSSLTAYSSLKNVMIHDFVNEIEPIFLMTDIFIVPTTIAGGISIKLLEALSYGIPVVCTKEVYSHLDNYESEVAKATSDPLIFAEYIEEFIDSFAERQKYHIAAKKYIQEKHSIEESKKHLDIILSKL